MLLPARPLNPFGPPREAPRISSPLCHDLRTGYVHARDFTTMPFRAHDAPPHACRHAREEDAREAASVPRTYEA
jgi:hypothetical protein